MKHAIFGLLGAVAVIAAVFCLEDTVSYIVDGPTMLLKNFGPRPSEFEVVDASLNWLRFSVVPKTGCCSKPRIESFDRPNSTTKEWDVIVSTYTWDKDDKSVRYLIRIRFTPVYLSSGRVEWITGKIEVVKRENVKPCRKLGV